MQPGTKTHVQSQEGVKNLPAGQKVVFCFSRFMRLRLVQILATVLCGSRQPQCSCKSWLKQSHFDCAHDRIWGRALTLCSSLRQSACRPFQVFAASRLALHIQIQGIHQDSKDIPMYDDIQIYKYIYILYIYDYAIFIDIQWSWQSDELIAAKASVIRQKEKTDIWNPCSIRMSMSITCHDMWWYFNFHGRRIQSQQKEPRKANKTKLPDRYLHWRLFLMPLQFFKSRWSGTIWRTWSRREHQMFVLCSYASYAYLLAQVKKANKQGCSQNGMRHCYQTAETHSSLFFVSGCKCCGRPLQRKRQPASKADEFKFVHLQLRRLGTAFESSQCSLKCCSVLTVFF